MLSLPNQGVERRKFTRERLHQPSKLRVYFGFIGFQKE
jgi:hypothetical protein